MVGNGFVQVFNGLVNHLYLGPAVCRGNQLGNFGRYLLSGERFVDFFHMIHHLFLRQFFLRFALQVYLIDDAGHFVFFQQFYGSNKCHEIPQFGHINAIAVRITDLWG
ncbi:hypothetical protein DSECCO2_446700 [anaerobic digester metagenome]